MFSQCKLVKMKTNLRMKGELTTITQFRKDRNTPYMKQFHSEEINQPKTDSFMILISPFFRIKWNSTINHFKIIHPNYANYAGFRGTFNYILDLRKSALK